jgi:hypothetical protein
VPNGRDGAEVEVGRSGEDVPHERRSVDGAGDLTASLGGCVSCASLAIRHCTDQELRKAFGLLTEGSVIGVDL